MDAAMNHDPRAWEALGRAIRDDRQRQGLSREELAQRVVERGAKITTRTLGSIERGVVPKRGEKPPTLEAAVAALGWAAGDADRILQGEDPRSVLGQAAPASPRAHALELLPKVYEFSRTAVAAGADPGMRDRFDRLAQQLVESVPSERDVSAAYGLAAYRPHAAGEGVPQDDADRIFEAMGRDA
ncbi:hypothetical protein ADK47_24125 [Streptomyces rimosus subsp. rimosus]|nr:hypothetical protein ADK84_37095 [Streptomyces sp. NRRL WC-3701]KOT42223.1 hypothetical protein ADK42_09865 [Streptomyces rimosus subsp. rimosus]KOT68520.1 hypothetical protein ADK44_00530 [Streptomyces rimosus subsp. rimosus]KOT73217.1 hypothetical protein ADK45_00530 [Streptomyces rimosus subsp. rimosus]KOT74733.1 hypothetical protein ADK47_24125 [Streptomyces rimosus subsp. rimosus]